MPPHQHVTTCRKSGGPISKHCGCEHCSLSVCALCGGGEGALTTDCPDEQISGERLEELCQTSLDYTDERGWHLGEPDARRVPWFAPRASTHVTVRAAHAPCLAPPPHTLLVGGENEGVAMRIVGCACGWRTPQDASDFDTAFAKHVAIAKLAPDIDWGTADRRDKLRDELMQKAVAWAIADRFCDDCSAALGRIEDEIAGCGEATPALRQKLESADIEFKLSVERAERCDDEFRQAARKIVAELEKVRGEIARAFVYTLKEGPEAALEFVAKLKEP